MTTRREDDGGPPFQPEGPQPVSGLPPEWGQIIIPDDAAELDHEAAKIRRELRKAARGSRWRNKSWFRTPIIIVAMAVLLALSSLFSILGPLDRSARNGNFTANTRTPLADIILVDEHHTPVRIGDHLPAVILLLDGCTCSELTAAISAEAPAGVSVLTVGEHPPVDSGPGIHLADPTEKIRTSVGAPVTVPTTSAVLLVNGQGNLMRLVPSTNSIEDFRADLEALRN